MASLARTLSTMINMLEATISNIPTSGAADNNGVSNSLSAATDLFTARYNTYDIFNWEYVLPTDTWTHAAVTWDGSTKVANLYINGSLYTSSTGTNVSAIYDTSAPFRIGQHTRTELSVTQFLSGHIRKRRTLSL